MKRYALFLLVLPLLCAFVNCTAAERTVYADQGGVAVFAEDGKAGLLDRNGDVILPAEYDVIAPFGASEWAKLGQGGRYGAVSRDGRVAVECAYDDIYIYPDLGMATAVRDIDHQMFYSLIDLETGKVLMNEPLHVYKSDAGYVYDLLVGFNDGWETMGPYRLCIYDRSLQLLLTLDGAGDAEPLGWGFVISTEHDPWDPGTYAVIDTEGSVLVDGIGKYEITPEGVCYVRYTGERGVSRSYCGLVNGAGIAFEVEGTEIGAKDGAGLYRVDSRGDWYHGKGSLWGYVDGAGSWIVEPRYETAGPFVDGSAVVREEGRYHLIDTAGRKVGGMEWSKAPCMTLAAIPADSDGGVVLIGRNGMRLSDEVFSGAALDTERYFRGRSWDTCGECLLLRDGQGRLCVIAADGAVLLRVDAEEWNNPVSGGGALWIRAGGLWGLMEIEGPSCGEWRIAPRFLWVYDHDPEAVEAKFEDGGIAYINDEGDPCGPDFDLMKELTELMG